MSNPEQQNLGDANKFEKTPVKFVRTSSGGIKIIADSAISQDKSAESTSTVELDPSKEYLNPKTLAQQQGGYEYERDAKILDSIEEHKQIIRKVSRLISDACDIKSQANRSKDEEKNESADREIDALIQSADPALFAHLTEVPTYDYSGQFSDCFAGTEPEQSSAFYIDSKLQKLGQQSEDLRIMNFWFNFKFSQLDVEKLKKIGPSEDLILKAVDFALRHAPTSGHQISNGILKYLADSPEIYQKINPAQKEFTIPYLFLRDMLAGMDPDEGEERLRGRASQFEDAEKIKSALNIDLDRPELKEMQGLDRYLKVRQILEKK